MEVGHIRTLTFVIFSGHRYTEGEQNLTKFLSVHDPESIHNTTDVDN